MDKTFDARAAEPRLYEQWEEEGAFRAGAGARTDETFSIVIPPPNVTGNLHMGHAFNNTLQDILTRWHRMRGHDTLWQPGTDHAGIATQMVVERELAKTNRRRTDMSREEFVDLVWKQKQASRGNIVGQLKRLGASCDWSREAFTMGGAPGDPDRTGPNFHDAVLRVFVDLYDKGVIYRGKRLVNWDPHFETAISDLEVEQVETDGAMWHFKYPLAANPETGQPETYEYVETDEDGVETFRETRDYISIATTRPETMLGDGAVAVHPSDARYAPIVGKLCEIPVGPKEHRRLIPIITDEYPDPKFGSGAVKITGAHDFNDYGVASRAGIPMYRLMDTRAHMRTDGKPYEDEAAAAQRIAGGAPFDEAGIDAMNLVPEKYRGLDRFEAREAVVADVTAEGLAVMVPETDPRLGAAATKAEGGKPPLSPEEGSDDLPETHLVPLVERNRMVQPTGDRSKVVIEPMLTDQWFVDAGKIVGPALEATRDGRTTIHPEQDAKVYRHWLENIEPWCISRQLWWGHRIPVWYGAYATEDGHFAHTAADVPAGEAGVFLHHGQWMKAFCATDEAAAREEAEAWYRSRLHHRVVVRFAGEAEDEAGAYPEEPGTDIVTLTRDEDVLDTWFSSGLWPLGTLGWPDDTPELAKYFPTSVLVTGFDIIFFWVARMMMMQLEVVKEVPFHHVYVHALVRDEKGKKMSKSLGNVLDPLDLIDEFGADAVRFTLTAMAAMGRDLKLSRDRVAGYRNFTTKLWNAARFAEMNGVFTVERSDANPTEFRRNSETMATANRWIVGETGRVREEVDAALDAFRFNDAANALYAFVWNKVCDWYIEFSKPLFDGEKAEETREVMAWVLDQCLILLHPMMPYVTEELWSLSAPRRESQLILAHWPSYGAELVEQQSETEMRWVISVIDGIRSARAQMNVPAGLQVPVIAQEMDGAARRAWTGNEALIRRLARIGDVTEGAAPKGAITIAVEGATFALPLADIIDIGAEKARLEKSLAKLEKEASGLRGRLGNDRFLASAPPDVVEESRDLLAQKEEEGARLSAALRQLAEVT